MKGLIRYIKSLFGKYEPGYEYWVYTKDIKVPKYFKLTKIGTKKWNHKMGYWLRTGEFESDILIDKDFNLVDGYSSLKIAHLKNIDKVPVYFVDQLKQKFYLGGENTYWEVNIYVQNAERFMILTG